MHTLSRPQTLFVHTFSLINSSGHLLYRVCSKIKKKKCGSKSKSWALHLRFERSLLKTALDCIVELEAKINRNSRNSSKPPSSDQKGDTPEKPKKTRASRQGFARTPYPPERVNHHVDCVLDKCPHCGSSDLCEVHGSLFSWQQVDLPPIQAVVTQFDCRKYRCGDCGQSSLGSPPPEVPSSAFGPKLMALIAELTGRFHMAKRDAMLLVRELLLCLLVLFVT